MTVERDALVVHASLARHGIAFVEVPGAVSGQLPEPSRRTDFYLKFLPAADGSDFDVDPVQVHCLRNWLTEPPTAATSPAFARGASVRVW